MLTLIQTVLASSYLYFSLLVALLNRMYGDSCHCLLNRGVVIFKIICKNLFVNFSV